MAAKLMMNTNFVDCLSKRRPLVFCGPSGSGKSTLIKRLFQDYEGMVGFSVSHTTRLPRIGEQYGVSYYFTDLSTMMREIDKGIFLEYAEFSGNLYGTSYEAVETVSREGKVCVLDIDMQGVKNLKKSELDPVYVFVQAPSMDILRNRLQCRGSETESSLDNRLRSASKELEYGAVPENFDYRIINDDLDESYRKLKNIFEVQYVSNKSDEC